MRRICLVLVVLAVCINAFAQEVVVASGGEAGGSYGSISYSIGQTFYSANIGAIGQANE